MKCVAVDSIDWVARYFPEYIVGGKPIHLTIGTWPLRVEMTTRETSPWRFIESYRELYMHMTERAFGLICDRYNYYRNGHRTPLGHRGLDPLFLVDGNRGWMEHSYTCPMGGVYWPGTRDKPARFMNDKGQCWTGDIW